MHGAHLSLATAYQNCEVLKLPAMEESTEDVQGIEIDGKHPNGVGDRFVISDLAAVLRTHYYWKLPSSQNANCRSQKDNPLIYDYGGKPWVSNQDEHSLNFFKNAGSGTEFLGIDCSGFVFSSLAAGGWKLSPQQKLEAKLVNRYSAKSFKEPEKNDLKCFEKVKTQNTQPLKAGDIIASSYHVAIVDQVSRDPFNFSRITTISECDSLDVNDFNFVLIHSAPYKGGVGINRVQGRDYIKDNFFFSLGMISYARSACRSWFAKNRFESWSEKQNPESKNLLDLIFGPFTNVVRHRQTEECLTDPLYLVGQECVELCPGL